MRLGDDLEKVSNSLADALGLPAFDVMERRIIPRHRIQQYAGQAVRRRFKDAMREGSNWMFLVVHREHHNSVLMILLRYFSPTHSVKETWKIFHWILHSILPVKSSKVYAH